MNLNVQRVTEQYNAGEYDKAQSNVLWRIMPYMPEDLKVRHSTHNLISTGHCR